MGSSGGVIRPGLRTLWLPENHGLITWTDDAPVSGNNTPLATAGLLYTVELLMPAPKAVTGIMIHLGAAGNTLTVGQCGAALFQAGAKIGVTADQAAAWATTGVKAMALSGGPFNVAATPVIAAVWFNGTTGPGLSRGNANTLANVNLAAASSRFGTADAGITTLASVPANLGVIAALSAAYWVALY